MNFPSPFFSLIIASYNNGDLIGEAILSAISQTYQDFELIISDNCSTDNSWEVISGFSDPRIKMFRHSTNLGMYSNLNFAVSQASGYYLKFLCSDDYLHPNCLECLHGVIADYCGGGGALSVHINHNLLRQSRVDQQWKDASFLGLATDDQVEFMAGGLPDVCLNRKKFISSGSFGHPNVAKDFSRDVLAFGLASIGSKKILVQTPLALERTHPNQSRHKMLFSKRYQLEEYLYLYSQTGRLLKPEGKREMNRLLYRHFLSSIKYLFMRRSLKYLLFVILFSLRHPRLLFYCF